MRPPIPTRVQRLSRRARTGCASSAAVGPRHAVVAAPQVSGLGTAYGRRVALCPPPQRQYGQSPALSRKGSVLHRKFTPVKSGPCLLHMCVAQWQACNALTDGRPQRYGAPGDECPVRARDKNAGIFRTVVRRVCCTSCTCRRRLALTHASGTFGSRRCVQAVLFVHTACDSALVPAPDEARGSRHRPECTATHSAP